MASYNPPKKNTAYRMFVGLRSQADTRLFQVNPTLASGDAKVSKDGGALANLATLPTVIGSSAVVQIDLSSTEMNADNVTIILSDAAGGQWCDLIINLQTAARQFDELASQASVDAVDDYIDTEMAAVLAAVDTEIAAIKAKTDLIPASPAAVGSAMTLAADAVNSASLAASAVAEIQAGLASQASVDAVDDYIDTEMAAVLAAVDTEIAAIKAKTDLIPASPAAVGSAMTLAADAVNSASLAASAVAEIQAGLSTLTPGQVNAEVVDALSVDTYAEPSGVPAATSSLKDKIGWMFTMMRNKRITTSTGDRVRNDADSADIGAAVLSEDGGTFTSGEFS